jgi:hypothetical protein
VGVGAAVPDGVAVGGGTVGVVPPPFWQPRSACFSGPCAELAFA